MRPQQYKDHPTPEEQQSLLRRADNGDDDARQEVVERNRALVRKVALDIRTRYPSMELEDFQHAVVIGLIDGVRKYDPSRGSSFSGYAVLWIKERMMRELSRMREELTIGTNHHTVRA